MPKAKLRARLPTFHRATTNVWQARIWSIVIQCSEKANRGIASGDAYESDQSDPDSAYLYKNALDGAIRASFDDPIVDPSNVEDKSRRLQGIIYEKGKIGRAHV